MVAEPEHGLATLGEVLLTPTRIYARGVLAARLRLLADGDDLRGLTPALLRLHTDLAAVAARHEGHVRRFVAGHPGVPVSTVPASATDIHDLEGLREVGAALGAG